MQYTLRRLKKHKAAVLFIAASTVLHSTFALGMAGYSKYVFDGIESKTAAFGNVLLLGLLVTAWGAASLLLKNISIDSLVSMLAHDMRSAYVEAVISCPPGKLKELGEGRILTDYSQNIGAVMNLVRSGLELITIPFEMVIALICLYCYDWRLATVVLVTFPAIMLSGKFIGKQIQKIRSRYMAHEDNIMNLITRIVRGIDVIKIHNYRQPMLKEFRSLIQGELDLDLRRSKYNGIFSGITDFFMGLPFTIVYSAAVFLVAGSSFTVGTLTLFLQLLNKITVPFVAYSNVLMRFKGARASVDRLEEIISGDSAPDMPIRGFDGVAFKDITFRYPNGKLLLKDCTLPLESGKYYGIIGENGSGKSTLCKLLMGLCQPVSGTVEYKKNPQKRNKIVYIEDNPVILFDDITRNIVVEGDADNARLERVLRETGLKSDAADNISGKKADELSAGLLQRMVIARAFYHVGEGDILVIDEGFSALDAENRNKMYRLAKGYQREYRLLVLDITHNMNEMDRFDRVIQVKDGRACFLD